MRKLKAVGAALVVALGLILAFLALFPDDVRGNWFQRIGLIPVPTITASQQPSTTPLVEPSATTTATSTTKSTTASTETSTPLPPTDTATSEPSDAASATQIPTTTLEPLLTSTTTPNWTFTPTLLLTESDSSTVTPTRGYPCEATITTNTLSQRLYVLRISPDGALSSRYVTPGERVIVTRRAGTSLITSWFYIEENSQHSLGWITYDYLVFSASCP